MNYRAHKGEKFVEFFQSIAASPAYGWFFLPAAIFCARVFDVSVGTLRIIFVSRGKRLLAPLFGFVEVCIWLLAISQIMQNLDNPACFLAYAGGFATGNYVGIRIEDKLAMGTLIIRVILSKDDDKLKQSLYDAGFGITSIDARGMSGEVKILYSIIKRRDLARAVDIIEKCTSNAFYSIEDAKAVRQGIFPTQSKFTLLPPRFHGGRHLPKQGK